jgi:hypothetical protein
MKTYPRQKIIGSLVYATCMVLKIVIKSIANRLKVTLWNVDEEQYAFVKRLVPLVHNIKNKKRKLIAQRKQ